MTTAANSVFIDTNVLVYAHLPLSPWHAAALATLYALAGSGADLWISRQTLREYLSAMTRPAQHSGAIPLHSLLADVARFQTQFLVAEDGPVATSHLLTLLHSHPCGGRQVYDANIVATMLVHGVPKLFTHNVKDFIRFASYITIIPLVP